MDSAARQYIDTRVTAGVRYRYYVTARNAVGSRDSTFADGTPPCPPGNFAVTSIAPGCNGNDPFVTLTWGVAGGATSYEVIRNGSLRASALTGTEFIDSTVTAGTSYSYLVRARNLANTTDSTNSLSVTPTNCPPGPFALVSAVPGCTGSRSHITLTWTAAKGATDYCIFRNGVEYACGIAGTQYINTGANVAPETDYTYFIRATNSAGYTDSPRLSVTSSGNCGNDHFTNRIRFSGTAVTRIGSNVGATSELGEPQHAGEAGGQSVWWSYTAPADGVVTVSTFGSTFDTLLAIYTGSSVGGSTFVASNDDENVNAGIKSSLVTFAVQAETEYQIAVDGYSGTSGDIQLSVSWTPPGAPPQITTASPLPPGTVGEVYGVTLQAVGGATPYRWTNVAAGLPAGLSLDAHSGTISGIPSAAGTSNLGIQVTGMDNQSSEKDFTLAINPAPTPINDLFARAIRIGRTAGAIAEGSNVNATKESGEPDHALQAGGRSVWWSWTAPFNGHAEVSTAGSSFDTLLGVYTGSSVSGLTLVAENDDREGGGVTSEARFNVVQGAEYFIAVDGYNREFGSIRLSVTASPRPANDNFADAFELLGSSNLVSAVNVDASAEPGEPSHAGQSGGKSVWWSWTAPYSGNVMVSTHGSAFDTLLAAYTGDSVPALTEVASNDDTANERTSRVYFNAVQDATYHIGVDGFSGAEGTIVLALRLSAPASPPVITTTSPLPGGVLGVAYNVSLQAAGDNQPFTWSGESGRLPPGLSLDARTGTVTGTPLATSTFVFRMRVAGTNGLFAEKEFELRIDPPSNAPGNDLFANRFEFTGTNAGGSSENATAEPDEPRHAGYEARRSVWWKWRAPRAGFVTVNTRGSDFDTVLAVYKGDAVSFLTKVASNDDEDRDREVHTSRLRFHAETGREYQLAVDGFDSASGRVALNLALENMVSFCGGPVQVQGDFITQTGEDVVMELCERGNRTSESLITVGGRFRAGGTLHLRLPEGYCPQVGDRFRLVEFRPETDSVDTIYDWYRFKDYDPRIPCRDDAFWGLTFREGGGARFIELMVLQEPQVWRNGVPFPLFDRAASGLVLLTHGTTDMIADPPEGGFGAMAEQISRFLHDRGNEDWDVVSLDWRDYATTSDLGAIFSNVLFYNAATSAQVGLGIGESFVRWLEANRYGYSKMHLLSHSSGSWLVNRIMQLKDPETDIHLTFFDAFTNPTKEGLCSSIVFCGRFESMLGDGGDFVEHYVERGLFRLPGTNDRLDQALNFDLTRASLRILPRSPTDGHRWPYEWYLETIRAAAQEQGLPSDARCGGFVLSSEYLESVRLTPAERVAVEDVKQTAPGSEYVVTPFFCRLWSEPNYSPVEMAPVGGGIGLAGVLQRTNDLFILRTLAGSGSGNSANATFAVTALSAATSLRLDFQFPDVSGVGTNGVLSVFLDGEMVVQFDQSVSGLEMLTSEEIRFNQVIRPGTHQLTLWVESTGGNEAAAMVGHFEFGLISEPVFLAPTQPENGVLVLNLLTVAGRTNYVIDASTNLTTWLPVTNVITDSPVIQFAIPVGTTAGQRFFRAVAP